jgi:ketosteroid isomerase-like protein
MNADEKAVADVLAQYQDALNQSDTDAVMKIMLPTACSCRSTFRPAWGPMLFAKRISRSSQQSR